MGRDDTENKLFFFHVPVMSFYSKALYRAAALHWRGTGFGYLFVMMAFYWIPAMILFQAWFLDVPAFEVPFMARQMPEITITNGETVCTAPQPVFIRDTGEKTRVVLDTTGKINFLEDTEPSTLVLLTRNRLWIRGEKDGVSQTLELSALKDQSLTLNEYTIIHWLDVARMYLVLVTYPLILLFSFTLCVLYCLLASLFGLLFAHAARLALPYISILRLTTIAATPAIVMHLVLATFGVAAPLSAFMLLTIVYLAFGVRAAREDV